MVRTISVAHATPSSRSKWVRATSTAAAISFSGSKSSVLFKDPILLRGEGRTLGRLARRARVLLSSRARSFARPFIPGLHDSQHLPLNVPARLRTLVWFWRALQQAGREVPH